MANDVAANCPATTDVPHTSSEEKSTEKPQLNTKCSVCCQVFKSVPECLKHELLSHSLLKKTTAKTGVDGRLKAANKFLRTPEKQEERTKVHNILQKCPRGKELASIFKVLCTDQDNLSFIFTRIQTCLERELSPLGVVKIYPFGSIASGLALRDSDIDIYLDASQIPTRDVSKSPKKRAMPQPEDKLAAKQRGASNRINSLLHRSRHFIDVFYIRSARVPIIKCKHRDTGFSIDINTSCPSSRENTQFICELVQSDRRIRELFLLLKMWGKNMQIIGRANMTSYCLITMVIFYLQQPWKGNPILKSVKQLQEQCRPHITQGVNYAFNLKSTENRPKIPLAVRTIDLLKGFFHYFKDFNFEDNIIAPFYGKSINKLDFIDEKFKEYPTQLNTITQYMQGIPADAIQLDRCMCVQDSFCLNHNVARTILPPNKKYFTLCLENADKICQNLGKAPLGEILERILYETISAPNPPIVDKSDISLILKKIEASGGDSKDANELNKAFNYFLEPCKSDLNCIANTIPNLKDAESFLRYWSQHYIEVIPQMLSDFYRLDMQAKSHTPQKQQRLETQDLVHTWHFSATVDLWSNRFFQKPIQQTFREYQMAQTERLHGLRRQNANYAVQINAVLTASILPDYTGINISITLPDGTPASSLAKKDPLRKFFNVLKNTLQNYSLKEDLQTETAKDDTKDEPNKETKI